MHLALQHLGSLALLFVPCLSCSYVLESTPGQLFVKQLTKDLRVRITYSSNEQRSAQCTLTESKLRPTRFGLP